MQVLSPYTIQYDVIHDDDKVGSASRSLEQLSNGQWQISMQSKIKYYFLKDKRQETSRFEVVDNIIRPLHYQRLADTSLKSDTTLIQQFDWQNGLEQGSYKDKKWSNPISIGLLDQLTQLLAVRDQLLSQQALKPIDISYRGGVRHHEFKVIGQETLKTAEGDIETAIVQLDEKGRERQTNFWFALNDNMLPLQIQRIKEGKEEAKLIATDW